MGKEEFRNWVCSAPELNESDDTDLPPINIGGGAQYKAAIAKCKIVTVDMLTWLSGVNAADDTTNAGELARRLRNSMLSVSEGRAAVFAIDKDHVPQAKGVTQDKRKAQQMGYSKSARMGELELQMTAEERERQRLLSLPDNVRQNIPRDRTFQEAVEQGIILRKHSEPIVNGESRREKSVNYHKQRVQDMEQQRLQTQQTLNLLHADIPSVALSMREVQVGGSLCLTERALLAVNDTPLPQPWSDVMSKNRDALLRYLVRVWMCAPDGTHLCPQRSCPIIIDGHCMTRDQWPVASDEQLVRVPPCRRSAAKVVEELLQDMDTPLMFMHPDDARAAGVMDNNVNLSAWRERNARSAQDHVMMDNALDALSAMSINDPSEDPECSLDMQISALLFGADHIDMRPRPAVVPLPNLHNKMGEADFGVFYYALELLKMHEELPRAVEIMSVDTDIFVLGLYFLYKWQNDMFTPYYSTRNLPLPTLLHTSGRGWSSAGKTHGTTNITAAYKRLVHFVLNDDCHRIPMLIAAVVSAGGDYTCVGYHSITMRRFIAAAINYQTIAREPSMPARPYLTRLVTFEWNEQMERWMPSVDGTVFMRLIRCVFFDTHRAAFNAHYMEVPHPSDLTWREIRAIINQHVTKSLPHEVVNDPNMVAPGIGQHERYMRALKKRIPPDEQLHIRALSLLHVMLMYNDVGLGQLTRYDMTQLGFGAVDPSRPIARDNIKSLATDDWEGREEKFLKVHPPPSLEDRMSIVRKLVIDKANDSK